MHYRAKPRNLILRLFKNQTKKRENQKIFSLFFYSLEIQTYLTNIILLVIDLVPLVKLYIYIPADTELPFISSPFQTTLYVPDERVLFINVLTNLPLMSYTLIFTSLKLGTEKSIVVDGLNGLG